MGYVSRRILASGVITQEYIDRQILARGTQAGYPVNI
jgi:hypothetical protein